MQITTSIEAPASTDAQSLVVFLSQTDTPLAGAAADVDQALGGALAGLVQDGEITGKRGQIAVVHTLGRLAARRVLLAGLGPPGGAQLEHVRDAAAEAARRARGLASGAVAFALPPAAALASGGEDETDVAQAVTEGALLGLYRFDRHLSAPEDPHEVSGLTLYGVAAEALARGVQVGEVVADAAAFCRDLANEPSNILTPTELARRASEWAEQCGLEVEILEEADAAELGMGSFLGVAKGSHEPAKFIVLRYVRGSGPPIGLIGKGITFDTGGISIKPAANMEAMKQDMSGAAAVIAAIGAIARLELPVSVVALAPATENMPGGAAIKPGDVLRAMNGKTIEVINTDAEGRLILADALAYANHLGLRPLVDVATLTGACAVALGNVATGVMTNDDALAREVIDAGAEAGEKLWQLPMYEEYDEQIKSSVADVKNTGGRLAGAQTAAKLLAKFAGETPWVHLDMAGTDDAEKTRGIYTKGATGVPVRSLVRFVQRRAEAGRSG